MSAPPTIFATATAAGRAAIAVIRVSGPQARVALRTLTRKRYLPKPRVASLCRLYAPDDSIIDDALVLWFPAPRSFTGENMVEFQTHGGPDIQAALLDALGRCEALSAAPPGGFTRQAVLNGRMDLTQAEAIADLVNADSPAQRWQALKQKQGALARLYDSWRRRLMEALAYVEAELEFVEDGVPAGLSTESVREMEILLAALSDHLAQTHSERIHNGLEVALIGAPNVGKSSLLNRLATRDVAIVSARAGTTRDIIEARLTIDGLPIIMTDMAGLRAARGIIEREGVRRAEARAKQADIRLFIRAPRCAQPSKAEQALYQQNDLLIFNKADLPHTPPADHIHVSAKTGKGLAKLRRALSAQLRRCASPDLPLGFTRARHREALAATQACLARALKVHARGQLELAAEDIRLATRMLGRITGQVDVEHMLDIVFADFCIGK